MLERNKQITSIAINTNNKNILVSASAGAGKTKLLVDRLIKLITVDTIEVSEILALTFTEAAAYEMKHRLQQAITLKLKEQFNPFLNKQLSLIETASISTIHSFCLSIIKDYSYVLNLDPKLVNNLLDEATKATMLNKCLEEVIFEEINQDDSVFNDLVEHLCERAQNLDPLKKAIKNIMIIRSAKVNPYQWDSEVLTYYNKVQKVRNLPQNMVELLQEYYLVEIQQLDLLVNQIIENYGLILEENVIQWISIKNDLQKCKEFVSEMDFDNANRAIISIVKVKRATIKDNDEYKKLRTNFNDKIKYLVEQSHDETILVNDLHQQQPLVHKLLSLTDRLMTLYQQEKVASKVMDFDDMEKYAFAILDHAHYDVANQYKQRFKNVLIDEFQDTNDVQHAIIMKVSKPDNVFRVGDIKQSIYRFRNAKPQLMRDLIAEKDEENITLVLPNNFRSSEDIVAFNNFVFSKLMNIPTFNDIYSDEDHVSIGLEKQISKHIPVELDVIDVVIEDDHGLNDDSVDEDNDENNDESYEYIDYDETTKEGLLKARHIAKRIIELNTQGYQFKDICILVRTHATKTFIKDVFDEVNIPYFIDTKSGFFLSQPIQDVLAFMRVINNPYDNISFIGLMKSAFFNMSFNEISEVAINNKSERSAYYIAFRNLYPSIITSIDNMIEKNNNKSLVDILHNIYSFNNFYHNHCDEQAKINLDYLLDKAYTMDKQNKHSINYFLSIIQNLQDEVSSEALPISSDADVVKVMTIHQSKGLQFPVVFFWTNNSNTIINLKEKVVVDAQLGIGLHTILLPYRYKRVNLLRRAIEFNSMKQELQEQIRLLYVGLTRAESLLICVALPTKESLDLPIDQNMIYRKKGNGHWLNAVFNQANYNFMKINKVFATTSIPVLEKKIIQDTLEMDIKQARPPEQVEPYYTPQLNFEPYLKASDKGSIIHDVLSKIIESNFDLSSIDELTDLDSKMKQQILYWLEDPFTTSFKSNELRSEYPIIMNVNDQYQQGYIDLLVQNKQYNIIVDFKSDQVATIDELIQRHKAQLGNYSYAIKHIHPNKEVKTYIYSLHLNCYIEI